MRRKTGSAGLVGAGTLNSHILVVDDDESIREFVGLALTDEGYRVVPAHHGAAALEVIAHLTPDLILLDMRMPVMDGWEFARRYREAPGPHAPIIVMTAAVDAADRAAQIGADGFLAKPFDLDELLDLVDRFAAGH
ncbi:MAG TPA: response regulator [Dehalococcoidia bacterium]|nr:response regulator [Dehalococcoidia bacterium]